MGKQLTIDDATGASVSSQGGREGAGGRNPDAASPPEARPRNSSGSRSPASQLVDVHLKIRILTRALMAVATQLGDEQLAHDLKQVLNGKV